MIHFFKNDLPNLKVEVFRAEREEEAEELRLKFIEAKDTMMVSHSFIMYERVVEDPVRGHKYYAEFQVRKKIVHKTMDRSGKVIEIK